MPSAGRQFKDAIYEQLGRVGKALASPRRLELLDLLCQGARTVEALANEAGQSLANTSQHLQVLRMARLVETEKHGLFVTYRLADEKVCAFYRELRTLAESRLHEIQAVTRQFLEKRGEMEPVDRDVLAARVRSGEVTLLDVRPKEEFEAGHLPGAVSVPLAELEVKLADLPHDREVVAYCRGPYCVLAVQAVAVLREKGFRAIRMEEGVPDWRARGLPIEMSTKEIYS
ncbi:MAG: ArsR family transcriptional regulator [Deltaproteobacteria bacterium RIFOXYA12_FULL_61_11]|nr:MAG: ArsR family transcriptional regulator [Deltaproteobacteria bacterium RIFOXYA12_FULL_61_11]